MAERVLQRSNFLTMLSVWLLAYTEGLCGIFCGQLSSRVGEENYANYRGNGTCVFYGCRDGGWSAGAL
jgi:hypothetical protein